VPSLGHFLVLSILLSFLSYVFYKYSTLPLDHKKGQPGYKGVTLLIAPGALLFALFHTLYCNLIYDSSINFETFKVLDMSLFTLIGFVSVAFLFSVPFLYMLKVFRAVKITDKGVVVSAVITPVVIFIPLWYNKPELLVSLVIFYVTVTLIIWYSEKRITNYFNKSVVFSVLFGLYSLFITTYLSEKKNDENSKIQLVAYSTEVDPVAEHLLLDMWPKISTDTVLAKLMNVKYFEKNDVDSISDYLHDFYFDGYWGNFTFTVVVCMKNEPLQIRGRNERVENCFSFFENKIRQTGHQLTGTGFYFMDNKLGRSNYLGRLIFDHGPGIISGLFIDFYSDINVFQPGYSEILLDSKYHPYAKLKNSSFAKYINGDIVLSTGDYAYNKTDASYIDKATDYHIFRADNYKHVLYRNGNVTVIISNQVVSFKDIAVSFAYLFIFVLICSNLILFIVSRPVFRSMLVSNFRQKLQVSFITILLISFTLIGVVISVLTVKQYKTRHYENLREKLNSVYVELQNRIGSEKYISSDWHDLTAMSLDELLVKLSNTFNSDINLYDLNGFLIATSRPEIFYRNLTSRRIDNMAFINLRSLNKAELFQREKIGMLSYVSGYIPFYNADNELLAYLNLPYFRMQSTLSMEISNTIVGIVNFMVLLIVIAMGIGVFISNRLTSPLTVLSSRLASVELGKKSEHLSYNGRDEVGDLVRQYNMMVDELDESAHKLARSEREYAWREMAKQIAHEIKNPLTPMKLNVQQLLKSWKDGVPGFEKKLEKFTRNQIEYIDNLSSIATAFSSFAKIPETQPVTVDLIQQVRTTLELFKNSANITFRIGWPPDANYLIYADKEQVNSIFSNIVKNAIQSIPIGREGIIRVNVAEKDKRIIVSVSDNGTGIHESLKKKMFTPNFTTKSSGTGLGLSIARQYAENAGGLIWFESEVDKGSVFHIEFPLMNIDKTAENPDQEK
jgi:signal transduction histidine kinase